MFTGFFLSLSQGFHRSKPKTRLFRQKNSFGSIPPAKPRCETPSTKAPSLS